MTTILEELEHKLAGLSVQDRAKLALALIRSLEHEQDDPGAEEAWRVEVEARGALLDSGKAELESGGDVIAKVRSRLG